MSCIESQEVPFLTGLWGRGMGGQSKQDPHLVAGYGSTRPIYEALLLSMPRLTSIPMPIRVERVIPYTINSHPSKVEGLGHRGTQYYHY